MRRSLIVVLTVALASGVALAARTELDLYATWAESESADAAQSMTLRVAHGDRLRVRAYLPLHRIELPGETLPTPFGAAPLTPEQRARRGAAQGNGPTRGSAVATGADSVQGLGDLRVGLLGTLAGGGARLFRIDGELDVKAPTGDEAEGLGTGAWDARIGLLGERRFWSATAFGGVGWTRVGDPSWIDLRDAADAYVGVETEPLAGGVLWSSWLRVGGEVVPGAGDYGELAVGARGSRRTAWRVALSHGWSDVAPDLSVTVGIGWSTGRARPRTPPETGR